MLTLTSVIKLWGRLACGKPLVSWHPLWKDLCQSWIVCFVKHSLPYAWHLSLTEHKNRPPPIVWNECPLFFSISRTNQHTRGFNKTTAVVILAVHGATCLIRKIYSSPTCFCAFEHCTSFPSFSTAHSPQRLAACRGLSTCSYRIRHISIGCFT